jgi:hypothetical protein
VSEASAVTNIQNLGEEWLLDKHRNMSHYEFQVSILNKDPTSAKSGFYSWLKPAAFYQPPFPTYDIDALQPLIIALDYQHSIAPLLVAQLSTLKHQSGIHLNFIKEFYTLYPLGLIDCLNLFASYFKHHINRTVYYIFDQTAVGKRTQAKPMCDIVIESLTASEFNVVQTYMGDTPITSINTRRLIRSCKATLISWFSSTLHK